MARTRVKKWVKKFNPDIIARRFAQVGNIASIKWGNIVPAQVKLEDIVIEKLRAFGIPEDQWPLYIGLVKKTSSDTTKFTYDALAREVELVVEEYKDRLLDPEVVNEISGIGGQTNYDTSYESSTDKDTADVWPAEETSPMYFYINVSAVDVSYISLEEDFLNHLKARTDLGVINLARCEVLSWTVWREYTG